MRKCFFHTLVIFLVLYANQAYSQIDSMMSVYADRLSPEKIHIHFDKSVYNRGETVWYKIYILQRGDTLSHNIYLAWYDSEGKWITQTSSPLVLSTASGSFDIPDDYTGESLQVKAFTSWMLNDDLAFSYQRQLIVNTNSSKKTKPVSFKTTVETFPEGGFLIEGLRTRLAFKANNQYGIPVFIRGVLADQNNQVLDSLNVEHDGMGSFTLMPEPGYTYHLNWIDEYGISGSTTIPISKTEGASLSLQKANGKAKFQIRRTDKVSENFKKLSLLVHMNQVLLYQVAINITEKTILNAEVPISELPTGLLQFTLFTSDWIPIAERVIFINNGSHEFDVKVKASLINVDKRGKNTLEFFVPDTLFTNMSLSVTDAAVNPPDANTIFSDILLSSEIKGKIYQPGYYLSSDADSVSAHLDLVMLTHGWRRFDWDKIKAGIPPKIRFPVETGFMKLNGRISGMKKNSSASDLNLIVFNKDSSRQFLSVPVGKDGNFEYPMIFFDTAKLAYSINNNPLLTEKVELHINNGLLAPEPGNIGAANMLSNLWNDNQARQKLNLLLSEQELIKKKIAETTLQEVTVTTKVKTKEEILNEKYTKGFFSGGPTKKEYILDLTDPHLQTTASNVWEYLQNRVPGLIIQGSLLKWRGDAPVIYLNEMRADFATIRDIPLLNVGIIKAFPPLFMFAPGGGRGGAIAVYTRLGNDDQSPTEVKGLQTMLLAGYTKFKEFYNPSYETPGEAFTKPDNRTTLYWNPGLITNKTQQSIQVDFFNNDFSRTFNVVLEGVNAAGKLTRVVRRIDANTKIE